MIGTFGFKEHLLYCKSQFWSLFCFYSIWLVSHCVKSHWCLLSTAVLEELVDTGRLKGSVIGGRQNKALYIPDIYSKTQNAWVDSFLKQNGYLGKSLFTVYFAVYLIDFTTFRPLIPNLQEECYISLHIFSVLFLFGYVPWGSPNDIYVPWFRQILCVICYVSRYAQNLKKKIVWNKHLLP